MSNLAPPPRTIAQAVDRIPDEVLMATDLEVLVQQCLALLKWPKAGSEFSRVGDPHTHVEFHEPENGVRLHRLTLHFPYTDPSGELAEVVTKELSKSFGSSSRSQCERENVFGVAMLLPTDDLESNTAIETFVRTARDAVDAKIAETNDLISQRRSEALNRARELLNQRVTFMSALASAKENLGIPITRTAQESVLLQPTGLDLGRAMARAEAGESQHSLQAQVREAILNTIRDFGAALERLPETATRLASLDEEALRDVLLFILNANWKTAVGEAFSGSGKTDISLWFQDRVAFSAELKVYGGEKQIIDAIRQLSGYAVWRDTHAALVVFIKDRKDITLAMDRVRNAVLSHPQCIDAQSDQRFRLRTQDSQRILILDLVLVPLGMAA